MLFINPAHEHFGGMLSRYVPVGIPVALGYLIAYLEKWGVKNHRVVDEEIIKITDENLLSFLDGQEEPLLIGITVLTAQAGRAYEIAKKYKEKVPQSMIICGGIHCTSLPHEPLETGAVDIVVRGEGEEVMRQLYFAIKQNKDWKNIKGISYIGMDGAIVHNPDGDLVDNLDDIPMFPYRYFADKKYDRGFIAGARGCPYKCSYCSQRLMTGLTYRWHSPQRIVEQLHILVDEYGVENITFYDDNFSVNRRRVFELCDAIYDSGYSKKCQFAIQTRADNLYEEIMPALKKANFTTVGFGMETGVERLATYIRKDQTVKTHMEKVELCRKWGINVSLFMIYGFPTETSADRLESWNVVNNADVGFAKFNNLIPYPGTAIYEDAKKSGRLHITPGWKNFNSTLSATRSIFDSTPLPYVPEGTTQFELKRDIIRRNFQYYFKWKLIKKILLREKGVGWVELPKYWFLKPRELMAMTGMAFTLAINLLFSLLPLNIGKVFFSFVRKEANIEPPKDIKGTMRSFKRSPLPKTAAEIAESKFITTAVIDAGEQRAAANM